MTIDFSTLPERVQKELLKEYNTKLVTAEARKQELLAELAPVEEEINAYSKLVKAFTPTPLSTLATNNKVSGEGSKFDGKYKDGEPYNADWSHAQKVKYVVDRPDKYGFKTLKGSGGIVDAILVEQPDWLKEMPNSATGPRGTLIGKIAPIISRMVDADNKQLVKLRTKGTKNEFHFISADWFFDKDETRVKPEYAEAITGLEPVSSEKTLAPAGAGANSEVTERNAGHPSIDAAGTLQGLISLNGHPNPTIFE